MQLVEPLLQLADEGDRFLLCTNRQLLEDIHLCFFSHRYPDRFSTSFLLDWLHSQQNRSWQTEGPYSPWKTKMATTEYSVMVSLPSYLHCSDYLHCQKNEGHSKQR